MLLNKSELYEQIALKTNFDKDDIVDVFKSAEDIIFDYLAKVEQNDLRKVFIMNGLYAESKIVQQTEKLVPSSGGTVAGERILLTAKISKRYRDKINQNR